MAILGQRIDRVRCQPLLAGRHLESLSVKPGEAGSQHPDPNIAAPILQNGAGIVARKPFVHGIRQRPRTEKLIQPILGAHPQASFDVLEYGINRTLRKPLLRPVALNLSVAQAAESVSRPDPKTPFAALRQTQNAAVGEALLRSPKLLAAFSDPQQS